ncbi:MAG TPA: hypothetical protein VG734_25940 [Lacunisphaera sp.]|nr:hypothetical protein [Lacunisphaera sp.]
MPEHIFKNWSVYADNAKHGLAQKATLTLPAGNESVITDDGHMGVSQGKVATKLSLQGYSPAAGTPEQDAIYRAWKTKKKLMMTCGPILGKLIKISMNVMEIKFDTDMVKGTNMMDIELEGGKPDEAG